MDDLTLSELRQITVLFPEGCLGDKVKEALTLKSQFTIGVIEAITWKPKPEELEAFNANRDFHLSLLRSYLEPATHEGALKPSPPARRIIEEPSALGILKGLCSHNPAPEDAPEPLT
jgi:hypothetical protein